MELSLKIRTATRHILKIVLFFSIARIRAKSFLLRTQMTRNSALLRKSIEQQVNRTPQKKRLRPNQPDFPKICTEHHRKPKYYWTSFIGSRIRAFLTTIERMLKCACRTWDDRKSITYFLLFTPDILIPQAIAIALHELKIQTANIWFFLYFQLFNAWLKVSTGQERGNKVMPNYMYNYMYFSNNDNSSEVNQEKCMVRLQIWRSERACPDGKTAANRQREDLRPCVLSRWATTGETSAQSLITGSHQNLFLKQNKSSVFWRGPKKLQPHLTEVTLGKTMD